MMRVEGCFMLATGQTSGLDLNDTVKSLLLEKANVLWSVPPDATVYEAIAIMSEKHIGALVVLMNGRLAGIITERDYARKIILKGRHSHETRVEEVMTTPVLYVTREHSIGQCMHLMTSRRIRHLPVLEGDRVVGMLSIGDLVNWIITAQKETIRHLNNYITGSYPA
jgi:signal-transduction protein with cAMP-binding, CBS, and nucleotidyltransferase domain